MDIFSKITSESMNKCRTYFIQSISQLIAAETKKSKDLLSIDFGYCLLILELIDKSIEDSFITSVFQSLSSSPSHFYQLFDYYFEVILSFIVRLEIIDKKSLDCISVRLSNTFSCLLKALGNRKFKFKVSKVFDQVSIFCNFHLRS